MLQLIISTVNSAKCDIKLTPSDIFHNGKNTSYQRNNSYPMSPKPDRSHLSDPTSVSCNDLSIHSNNFYPISKQGAGLCNRSDGNSPMAREAKLQILWSSRLGIGEGLAAHYCKKTNFCETSKKRSGINKWEWAMGNRHIIEADMVSKRKSW